MSTYFANYGEAKHKNDRAGAEHVWGSGFYPQHQKEKKGVCVGGACEKSKEETCTSIFLKIAI